MALAKQAQQLASAFNQAATTHQTVAVVSAQGEHAKLPQNLGHVMEDSQLPHMEEANIAIVGKAGVGITAGQNLVLSSGDTAQIASGQDSQIASGGLARIHTGQAIGILAGAIQAGAEAAGKGLSLIAAQGDIDMQAQAGTAQIASKQALEIKSANGAISIASAKKITLAVAGGASITIEGGSFTAQCPGKIMVQAGKKSMVGGGTSSLSLPAMPTSKIEIKPVRFALKLQDFPGSRGTAPSGQSWRLVVVDAIAAMDVVDGLTNPAVYSSDYWDETLFEGSVGADGGLQLTQDQQTAVFQKVIQKPGLVWLISGLVAMPLSPSLWTTDNKLPNPKRQLDAMNFAPDGRDLDLNQQAYLEEIAKRDAQVGGLGQLKPKTDL
jgi:uncharacterized protein (DUF2345 family)